MVQARENWGSRVGFILAAAGSAVGLGNIWRFPYVAGESGGGVFILIYLICVVVLGLPVMLVELSIGRNTQRNPVGAFKELKPGTPWFMVGGMGVAAGFLILSYYAVVAGWTLGYVVESLRGALSGASAEQISAHFDNFTANPLSGIGYYVALMIITIFIVGRGVKGGIERSSKILMPALFIMLVLVMIRSLTLPGAAAGLKFIFWPDFSKLDQSVMMRALGQAFFSMSLGMGAMVTYGSYLGRKEKLPSSATMIAGLDLGVALLGGMAIFPALFAFGMDPEGGTGLAFKTLPVIFGQIPLGTIIMPIFFLLLTVAALTSTISLLEVITAYFIDEKGWKRRRTAVTMGLVCVCLGIPSALSSGLLSADNIGISPMDFLMHVTADYMLPIGALLMSIFVGFVWKRETVLKEVREGTGKFPLANVWIFIVRYLAPFVIGQILLLGILNEFNALNAFVEKLNNIFSIVDGALVVLLIVGTVVYLLRKKRSGATA